MAVIAFTDREIVLVMDIVVVEEMYVSDGLPDVLAVLEGYGNIVILIQLMVLGMFLLAPILMEDIAIIMLEVTILDGVQFIQVIHLFIVVKKHVL